MLNPLDLGEYISELYDTFFEQYGDEDLAAVATAAVVNEIIATAGLPQAAD